MSEHDSDSRQRVEPDLSELIGELEMVQAQIARISNVKAALIRRNEPTAPTPGGPAFTANIITNLLDLSERRLQQLVADGWMPAAVNGKYSLKASMHGYIRYLKRERATVAHRTRRRARELPATQQQAADAIDNAARAGVSRGPANGDDCSGDGR